MTRKEHISNLETIGCDGWTVTTEAYKSLQWAIQSLSQEPCDDAISRVYIEPIIEELENICINGDEYILNLLAAIKNAPSVTQKSGQWIYNSHYGGYYECSVCGKGSGSKHKECPNCRAKMESEE